MTSALLLVQQTTKLTSDEKGLVTSCDEARCSNGEQCTRSPAKCDGALEIDGICDASGDCQACFACQYDLSEDQFCEAECVFDPGCSTTSKCTGNGSNRNCDGLSKNNVKCSTKRIGYQCGSSASCKECWDDSHCDGTDTTCNMVSGRCEITSSRRHAFLD